MSDWVEMKPGLDLLYEVCRDEACPNRRDGTGHAHFRRYDPTKSDPSAGLGDTQHDR
jgi:hypothetical protein